VAKPFKRKDGRWCVALTLPDHTRRYFYAPTRNEVLALQRAAERQIERGGLPRTDRTTVGVFLRRWLDDVMKPTMRYSGWRSYDSYVRKHLVATIGDVPLQKLTAQQAQRVLSQMVEQGYPAPTVRRVRVLLKSALDQALEWGMVTTNVAVRLRTPTGTHPERPLLSIEEIRALLRVALPTRDGVLILTSLVLGLRQGELLGLKWSDVDWDNGRLRVERTLSEQIGDAPVYQETKTKAGRRDLPLPSLVSDALRARRRQQLEDRLKAGATWQEHGLMFTTTTGIALRADTIRKRFYRLCAEAGITSIVHWHDLRHATATMLVEAGVDTRTAMEILGHRDIKTTELVYRHTRQGTVRQAVETLADVVGDLRDAS
jgi:integrase